MTEEVLNRHTDPSGLLASVRAASDGRPYLGSPADVERVLRQFAAGVLERYDEVGHGVLTPEDAANADRAECLRLAGVFCGNDPAYAPVRNWTGAPLAEHLRGRMERELVPDEDDAATVAQAFAVLVHTIYGLMREADGADESSMQQTLEAAVRSLALALVGVVGND
jgi:hypothetical protein